MKTILVPTDFSPAARKSAIYAINIAKKTGSRLLFFHSSYFSESKYNPGMTYQEALEVAKKNAEQKLRKESLKIFAALKISPAKFKPAYIVEFGPSVYDNIMLSISRHKPSLIVMGTHGATGVRKILFGSNTENIIAHCDVPVLAVPASHKASGLKELVYSTDLSKSADELKKINSLNKNLKAKISVVFADYGWAKTAEEEKNLAKLQKNYTVKILDAHLETTFAEYMNKFMKGKHNSALCMFHEKKSGLADFLLGSKTEGISLALNFPLLVFQKEKK